MARITARFHIFPQLTITKEIKKYEVWASDNRLSAL